MTITERWRAWVNSRGAAAVALLSAWVVVIAVLLAWLLNASGPSLRAQLRAAQFWSLEACVLLGLSLGYFVMRELLGGLAWRDGLRMGGLALLAVGLMVLVVPRTSRIYYDEQIYQGIGQNLSDLKLAQMCNDGTVEYGQLQCWSGEYNKQPYAYPHVLSLVYRLVGVRPGAAFVVNAAVMGLTVVTLYLLVLTLFRDRAAAFFAGLLLVLLPMQLVWSGTAAAEPSASLACVVAVLAAAHYSQSTTGVALMGTAVATAYAVQFRPESILILPVVGLLVWPRVREEIIRPRLWWVGLLFVLLVAVHVGHLVAVRNENWGTTEARLSLQYVWKNLKVNGGFYVADERFPVVLTVLAAFGLSEMRFVRARASMAAYLLLFFGIFLLFYAGSYNYGADVRYSLMTYPPLAALGGLGAARVARWLEPFTSARAARGLVAAGLAVQFLWYAPLVRSTTEEAWAARADVRFARAAARELSGNTYVLTHNPSMFHLWGVNAGQMSLVATNPSYLEYLRRRYRGGVYLHWNYWCNTQDQTQQDICRRVLSLTAVETVREYRERDYHFAIYRMAMPAPNP